MDQTVRFEAAYQAFLVNPAVVAVHSRLGVKRLPMPHLNELAKRYQAFETTDKSEFQRMARVLQQIWRDHMLAGVHLNQDQFDDGFFVFLYPKDNADCSTAIADYSECLSGSDTFAAWTLEEVATAIKSNTDAAWIDRFIDRYLNFDKLMLAT